MAADLALEVHEYYLVSGRIVGFDLDLSNDGNITATEIDISAQWFDDMDMLVDEVVFEDYTPNLPPDTIDELTLEIPVPAGAYTFTFNASTDTVEEEADNNSESVYVEVEYVDLDVEVWSVASLGWDESGNAYMWFEIDVENQGVDDSETFVVGLECVDDTIPDCIDEIEIDPLEVDTAVTADLFAWLPVGEHELTLFAGENDDGFRWGDFNVVQDTFVVPPPPEQVWTVIDIGEPEVVSYWSDGSANVDFELYLAHNSSSEITPVSFMCNMNGTVVDDCGTIHVGTAPEADEYPTITSQTARLPAGETIMIFNDGTDTAISSTVTVPEGIIGVKRDAWECYRDTSYVGTDKQDDSGIGCGGWTQEHIVKWPPGEPITVWITGEDSYIDVVDEMLEYLQPLLNLEYEHVLNRSDAQLVIHTGWPKEDAEVTGVAECVDAAGCALTNYNIDGEITDALIAIWISELDDDKRNISEIRATTLHELMHALTDIAHRHHDRTSAVSYDAISYDTVYGMDADLLRIWGDPLVRYGMTFDEVEELIIFEDELNDPPDDTELTPRDVLRDAHAALMDAETAEFEVSGGWPQCGGEFTSAHYGFANPPSGYPSWEQFPAWEDFHYGSAGYTRIAHPKDQNLDEYWIWNGSGWRQTDRSDVFETIPFWGTRSSPFHMLEYINIWADDSDFTAASSNQDYWRISISIDGPNQPWSRSTDLDIHIDIDPETLLIMGYKMDWQFDPTDGGCDRYIIRARDARYGFEFTFPDAIRERSALLN